MRKFKVEDPKSLFDMKQVALNHINQMTVELHSLFAIVQNEGQPPITEDDLRQLSETFERFGDAYNEIDDLLLVYAQQLIANEVTDEG